MTKLRRDSAPEDIVKPCFVRKESIISDNRQFNCHPAGSHIQHGRPAIQHGRPPIQHGWQPVYTNDRHKKNSRVLFYTVEHRNTMAAVGYACLDNRKGTHNWFKGCTYHITDFLEFPTLCPLVVFILSRKKKMQCIRLNY